MSEEEKEIAAAYRPSITVKTSREIELEVALSRIVVISHEALGQDDRIQVHMRGIMAEIYALSRTVLSPKP